MTAESTPETRPGRALGSWAALALAMIWVALVRVPLVLNAETHLDSDLAVDGLTLIESMQGQWRWHYPGTPHIGTPAVLLSLPQAAVWGADPRTLVSGGVAAYELVVLATFLLIRRAFGPAAAAWSLVPLAFASPGTVWLSGRITGGHLLAAAWHAWAFALLHGVLSRGGPVRAGFFGLWCGLGLYVDQLFLFSLFGLVPGVVAGGFGPGRPWWRLLSAAAFVAGLACGYAPHRVGMEVDDYDAYSGSFSTIFVPDERTGQVAWDDAKAMAAEHGRLLALECLPRLIGGHRLPGFQSEPSPESLRGRTRPGDPPDYHPTPIAASALALSLFIASALALVVVRGRSADAAGEAVRWGLVFSSAAVLGGFVVNRNIYNSDNYRYLVFLLVPWAAGFGLMMSRLARAGGGGRAAAILLSAALAVSATLDTARWYRGFGWVDGIGRPVRQPLDDFALEWLRAHPETTRIYGSYWDVYRLSFLTGGRVGGVPYPEFPDRYFPENDRDLPAHRPRTLIARGDGLGRFNRGLALREGGKVLAEGRGVWIIDWP